MPVTANPFPASKILPYCPFPSHPLKIGRKYLPALGFYDPVGGDTYISRCHVPICLCFLLRTCWFHFISSHLSTAPDWLGGEMLQNYVKQDLRAYILAQDWEQMGINKTMSDKFTSGLYLTMAPVSSIPWGISFVLPSGKSRRWWIHKVNLPLRWRAHIKCPVFLRGLCFGCKHKCQSCPWEGCVRYLKGHFPVSLAETARWIQLILPPQTRSVMHQEYIHSLSFHSLLTGCPCPWDPFQLLTLHWGYLYNHISVIRY